MDSFSVPAFSASMSIGLHKGYSNEIFGKYDLIAAVREFQKKLISDKNNYLTANIFECELVLGDYSEPHIKIECINFPRFPLDEIIFKQETKNLAIFLMKAFSQNRMVIVYHNETTMIEINHNEVPVFRQ